MTLLLLLLFLSFLAGSIPTSIIAGQVTRGIDIRDYGSGNAGGTNALRVLGWKAGATVVMLDAFKGWFAAAVISGWRFGAALGQLSPADPHLVPVLCGAAAMAGHSFSLFAGFRGGKGVSTLGGMLLYLYPGALFLGVLVWLAVLAATGYVSLGSVTAVTLFPIAAYLQDGTLSTSLGVVSLVLVGFIWFTHRANLARLLAGTENRFEKVMIFKPRKTDA
ncbi:MAG: glycerol-3-phosphate 1-O-acyltransferase PlsY [Candidatus Neomarinimicrobiota bacterium]